MNVALFGGTFDPVHSGHLAAARAAMKTFRLDQIHFVPSSVPPHKRNRPLTEFAHRYAMVALACAGVPQFFPSLMEAPGANDSHPNYSIVTVRKTAAALAPGDRLYFLIGADAFREIAEWHEPVALLDSCDFIIASRPGFAIREIQAVIPAELRGGEATETSLALRRTCVHLLNTVEADISSSAIRRLASEGKPLAGLVPDGVAEYIQKAGLFVNEK